MVNRAAAAVVLVLAFAASAFADSQLGWEAPAGCPSSAQVRARIEQRLGAPMDDALSAIDIRIARDGRGFVAQVDLRALTVANDVRELHAKRCDALVESIAIIVARLANEARSAPRPPPLPTTLASLSTPPAAVAAAADDAPDPVDRRPTLEVVSPPPLPRWTGGVRLVALSGIGAQPSVGLGGEVAGYVGFGNLIAELGLSRWSPRSTIVRGGEPVGLEVGFGTVVARGGWTPRPLPIRVWMGLEFGNMALDNGQVGVTQWAALNGGFGVAWRFTERVHIVGSLEVAVPFGGSDLMMNGRAVYEPSYAAVRSALGLEVTR